MITLYQFPPQWDLPNASPFCMKLETYLRMAELPYQAKYVMAPQRAPKGKLPYIVDQGKIIGDSSLIIDYLKQTYGDSLDKQLNAAQRATALMLQRLLEESLYWRLVYMRWIDPANWPQTRRAFFGALPPGVNRLVGALVRRQQRRDVWAQGTGRHTPAEIERMGVAEIEALIEVLGDKPFLLGDTPAGIDAGGYAFIANLIWQPITSPLKERARASSALVAYGERMRSRYYG